MENLQILLALRALGLAGNRGENLHCLDILVVGTAFWDVVNVGRLWDPFFDPGN